MICTNCGKDIPYDGHVCAYCGADKTADKRRYKRGNRFGIAMLAAGFVGGLIGSAIDTKLICPGVLLGVICVVVAISFYRRRDVGDASEVAVTFYCQNCGTRLEASRTAQGKSKACPKCSTQVAIPTVSEMTSKRRSNMTSGD